MIEIPICVFVMLIVGFSLFMCLMLFGIYQVIRDRIIDYVQWKTNYKKYKKFWDDHEDWR